MKEWMAWYKILSPNLMQAAYKTGDELAWPEEQALQVISLLASNGYIVSGIKPWLPTTPGPTPLIYDWPLRRSLSSLTADDFIRQFAKLHPAPLSQTPVFNISAERKNS